MERVLAGRGMSGAKRKMLTRVQGILEDGVWLLGAGSTAIAGALTLEWMLKMTLG